MGTCVHLILGLRFEGASTSVEVAQAPWASCTTSRAIDRDVRVRRPSVGEDLDVSVRLMLHKSGTSAAVKTLRGRNAVITGATGGLGRPIAKNLAESGADLLLVGRDSEALSELAAECEQLGARVSTCSVDLLDPDAVAAIEAAAAEHGPVDLLVNNAGIEGGIVPFERQSAANIERIFRTNTTAPMALMQAFLPQMMGRGRGNIVNITSLAGQLGMAFGTAYAASKAALHEASLSLAEELRTQGSAVKVSAVSPGFVAERGMFARKGHKAPAMAKEVEPERVARAVVRAVETGTPEILVSGRPPRLLMAIRALSPSLAGWIGRQFGISDFLESISRDPEQARQVVP